jgi:RNA polymerase sigma-70 factor (ECF subfamily)
LSRSCHDAEAFLALLRPLQAPLEAYCRRLLADRSQAEDVLQSAVAEAFARFASFDRAAPGANFRAWMFRFVTLEAFNRNRKRRPQLFGAAPPEAAAAPADAFAEEDWDALLEDPDRALEHFDDTLADALRRLPPPERAALLLRAVGELTYHEIHQLLSIPLGSVMGYLSRARWRLRRALADYAAARGLPGRGAPSGESHP